MKQFNCVQNKMNPDSFKNVVNNICLYLIYMYKKDLALNTQQLLIPIKHNKTKLQGNFLRCTVDLDFDG